MSKPKKRAPEGPTPECPRGGGSYVRDPATGRLTRVIEEPQSVAEADAESGDGETLDPNETQTDPAGTADDNEQEA